jgi:hypothetical protein
VARIRRDVTAENPQKSLKRKDSSKPAKLVKRRPGTTFLPRKQDLSPSDHGAFDPNRDVAFGWDGANPARDWLVEGIIAVEDGTPASAMRLDNLIRSFLSQGGRIFFFDKERYRFEHITNDDAVYAQDAMRQAILNHPHDGIMFAMNMQKHNVYNNKVKELRAAFRALTALAETLYSVRLADYDLDVLSSCAATRFPKASELELLERQNDEIDDAIKELDDCIYLMTHRVERASCIRGQMDEIALHLQTKKQILDVAGAKENTHAIEAESLDPTKEVTNLQGNGSLEEIGEAMVEALRNEIESLEAQAEVLDRQFRYVFVAKVER